MCSACSIYMVCMFPACIGSWCVRVCILIRQLPGIEAFILSFVTFWNHLFDFSAIECDQIEHHVRDTLYLFFISPFCIHSVSAGNFVFLLNLKSNHTDNKFMNFFPLFMFFFYLMPTYPGMSLFYLIEVWNDAVSTCPSFHCAHTHTHTHL